MEEHTKFCSETLVGRHSLRDMNTDGRIILKCIYWNRVWSCGIYSNGSGFKL